jgi:hypothetical protein
MQPRWILLKHCVQNKNLIRNKIRKPQDKKFGIEEERLDAELSVQKIGS